MAANGEPSTPDTIVFVHGLWLTPRGWDGWADRYRSRGYTVLTPAWPGMEAEVEVLRRDPSPMNGLGVTEVADYYTEVVTGLEAPPIIMGHSFGGLVTQILLDQGLGAAGVAIHPAPVKGVLGVPPSSLRAGFPILRNPANRKRTVALTPKQWRYGFTNTLSVEDARRLYDRYHVPTSGRPLWQAVTANLNPNAATKVNFGNDRRAPLLLVAGGADHTIPPSLVRETAKRHRKSSAVTDYREYPGRPHFTMAVPGWEQVADDALAWAVEHGTRQRATRPSSPMA